MLPSSNSGIQHISPSSANYVKLTGWAFFCPQIGPPSVPPQSPCLMGTETLFHLWRGKKGTGHGTILYPLPVKACVPLAATLQRVYPSVSALPCPVPIPSRPISVTWYL